MQVSKVIPYTPVVACNTNIPIPDAGAGEVTGPFGQGSAVRSFIDPDRQANGRDLERPQVSAGVVEIACDGGKRWAAPVAAAVHSRISDAPCLRYQAAALQRTGNQVGGQGCAGAGEIAGWAAEAGRDQGCVLAPVHIGIFPLIDRIIAGGPAEQVILWGVHRVFQRAGLTNAQGAYHCRQQKDAQFQSELTSAP